MQEVGGDDFIAPSIEPDRFVTARCGADDPLRGWKMRAQLSYVDPHSEQSVSSVRRCATG